MIEFLLSNLLTIVPAIFALLGFGYGAVQKSGKTKAKAEAAHQKMKADGEKKRAIIAEETRDLVIAKTKESMEEISNAGKEPKNTRTRFSDNGLRDNND